MAFAPALLMRLRLKLIEVSALLVRSAAAMLSAPELPQLLAGTASLERYPLSDAQAAALAQALKMP